MICLAAQKRRSSNDPLVVSEAVTWFLETDLSVSSARIRARIKNLVGDIHIAFIGSRLLESGVSIGKNWFLIIGLSDRGAIVLSAKGNPRKPPQSQCVCGNREFGISGRARPPPSIHFRVCPAACSINWSAREKS